MVDASIEGIVKSFKLTKETHKGPYSNSKEIPIISIGISDGGALHSLKLPIDISNNPLSVRLIENELIGQKVSYHTEYKTENEARGMNWGFKVISGRLRGVEYRLEELIDW